MIHQGHKVLYSDYSNLGTDLDALAKELATSEELCLSQPDGSVLNLANVEGSFGTVQGVEMLKKAAVAKKHKMKKTAVLGATGVRALLAQGIAKVSGTNIRYFDDRESALAWLVEK
jgi:hypothetical protein